MPRAWSNSLRRSVTSAPATSLLPERIETVAHRAGNRLADIRAAIEAGVDWIEADIWWQHGRLEARHEHAIWSPRILIDLKGPARRLPHDVVRTLRAEGAVERSAICGRNWRLLDAALAIEPGLCAIYSIGTERELAAVRGRPPEEPPIRAVSCEESLLTAPVIAWLRERDIAIFAWTVNECGRALELANLGVSAIISDSIEVLDSVHTSFA